MRLPRNLSGEDLTKQLSVFGYKITRQTGSHMRLTTHERGEHHITIPRHPSLRIGTLASALSDVALHFNLDRQELMARLFKK
ncbi:MAG: type II toxin-antitoxin system HicA family toxin [Deltaproteobacteria bacterium]|nr:type II toxin-antitoxin system HicA family toxin [Deltaproteobacteria bacterium]